MVLLCYPLAEFFTPLKLAGHVSRNSLTETTEVLNAETWFDGSFQESLQNYMNDQIGLFPFFIRLHNQIEYSFFGNIYTGNVVAGKENYLFEKQYINSYFGKDFMGMEKIHRIGDKLIQLQDTLEKMDKILVYCLATGKANYYPEHLPYTQPLDTTNTEMLTREFERRGINHINFTPWFLEMKDTLGHLLFPQYGIHWSHFSTILVTDSLVKFIEAKTGWDLPNIKITDRNISTPARYFDNDIANSLNLFSDPQPPAMAYPSFEWDKPKKTHKKILLVGDSFGWDLFENLRLGKDCFDEMQFWFYYQSAHTRTEKEGRKDGDLPLLSRHVDLYKVLMEYDAFVILSNEPNSVNRGWGFPKDALFTILDSNYVIEERGNEYIREQCYTKRTWRETLQKMADKRNISLDSMVELYLHDRNFKLD